MRWSAIAGLVGHFKQKQCELSETLILQASGHPGFPCDPIPEHRIVGRRLEFELGEYGRAMFTKFFGPGPCPAHRPETRDQVGAKTYRFNYSGSRLLIDDIRDALNTEETGDALVEVARNAARAEMELASIKRREDEETLDEEEAPSIFETTKNELCKIIDDLRLLYLKGVSPDQATDILAEDCFEEEDFDLVEGLISALQRRGNLPAIRQPKGN